MNNEIVKTEAGLPANAMAQALEDAGVSIGDIVIPKLLLMQNTSEIVADDGAKMGDIVNSQTLEVLGGVDKPVEFIPLKLSKIWRVYDVSGGNPVYKTQYACTPQNERDKWEFTDEDGNECRRDLCFLVYSILTDELAVGEAFPVVISFHRTGMQAGKQVATHLFRMIAAGKDPLSRSLQLQVSKDKSGTNTYAVYSVGKGNEQPKEIVAECRTWLQTLKTKAHVVHEETVTPTHDLDKDHVL